ncbi:cytochrome P450 4V3 [Hypoxylon trugodes]|uniref:cytochrome P450 4V3 n=1 Tax=Hypoxylon trugodes TaxID=326681 RepID=UPI0021926343|nr:cytochrome P450 4V3 [Hypoxylon trugodes]KAI1385708.1 cytochrome P450 4V3 [Hypoxylon trugodes]
MELRSLATTDAVQPLLLRSLGALIAVLVVRILYKGYIERGRVGSLKAQGIPVLPHSLLYGHLPIFADFRAVHPPDINAYQFHNWLATNSKKYFPDQDRLPPVVYVDLWPVAKSLAIVYDQTAAAQFIQAKSLPKDHVNFEFMKPLTNGLDIVSAKGGDLWKRWRSRFNPGFSSRNLTAMLPELIEEVQVFADGLKNLAGKNGEWGSVFQLENRTTNLTFDVIVRASLDLRLHEQSRSSPSPFKTVLMKQIEMMNLIVNSARAFSLGKMPWDHAAIRRNNQELREILLPHIENKMHSDINASQKKTIVDLALKYIDKDDPNASPEKPDTEFIDRLIANVKAFIFAGHDTTSSTICFMVKLLQDHPESLARLQAEHDSVLGSDPDKAVDILSASPHLLYSLPYTLGVVKETLRLNPLAATIRDSMSIPGFTITAPGSPIKYPLNGFGAWVSAPGIMRRSDYWPRPDEFLPERWVAVEGDPLHVDNKDTWLPFSLGPRNCVGMELAMIELRLVCVVIARTFDIREAWEEWDKIQGPKATPTHLVNGKRLYGIGNSTVHPKDGMPVHVRMRSYRSATSS